MTLAVDHLTSLHGPGSCGPVDLRQEAEGNEAREPPVEARRDHSQAQSRTIEEVVSVFQHSLHLPDPAAILVTLAAVAANLLPGGPFWLLLVGVPSSGKTEILQSLTRLPHLHAASTLTEGALLSGTSRKERAANAKGGLLREVGDFGIIVAKDFGSCLSMNRDTRAALFAALREIYDGAWTRHVGTDGGQSLSWTGKVGFLGGVTPVLDRHHEALSSLGDRFVLFRFPATQEAEQAHKALRRIGHEGDMHAELSEAVAGLFAGLTLPTQPPSLTDQELDTLASLATFAARSRSAVVRDSYSREIDLIPGAEAPARLALAMAQLLAGLRLLGVNQHDCWRIVTQTALDSMPAIRRRVLLVVSESDEPLETARIASAAGYPAATARRALEELNVYAILDRAKFAAGGRNSDTWELSEWSREQLRRISEKSVGMHT